MDNRSSERLASRDLNRARRALWIFVAVAGLCVIQVAWWMACQIRHSEKMAELEKAELDLRSLHISIGLSEQISSVWEEVNEMVMDTAWTGGVPRTLHENTLVQNVNRFPTVTRRIQSPFGSYDMDNWTWTFQGPRDTLWVTLDPLAVANLVAARDTAFEFRGEAPFPGPAPFVLDPSPVRPKTYLMEQLDRDRRQGLLRIGAEAGLFLLLVVVGMYLLYRTAIRTT